MKVILSGTVCLRLTLCSAPDNPLLPGVPINPGGELIKNDGGSGHVLQKSIIILLNWNLNEILCMDYWD